MNMKGPTKITVGPFFIPLYTNKKGCHISDNLFKRSNVYALFSMHSGCWAYHSPTDTTGIVLTIALDVFVLIGNYLLPIFRHFYLSVCGVPKDALIYNN